ncbi:MAG: C4-dicarboxylate TRAP transporter substrate-binding protein [Marinobacter sp.]
MIRNMVLSTIIALVVAGTATAETVLRYAEGSPNRGTRADAMMHFFEEAEKLSGGDLAFDVHWGGALFDYKGVGEGVSTGAADMGSVVGAYNPSKLKAITIGDLTSGHADPWVGMRAMYELMTTNQAIQDMLAEENLVYVTGYSSTGIQFECAGDTVIRTVDDLKGKRIRGISNWSRVLKGLGANVVNLSAGEIYQALDTGLLDCSASYLYSIRTLKTHDVINSVTVADWGQLSGFLMMMNRDVWNGLSQEQQATLHEAGSDMIDFFGETQIEEMDAIVKGLREGSFGKKVAVYEMPEEEREKLTQASEKYGQSWAESVNKDGLPGDQIWSEYQALLEKYETERTTQGYPWER